MKPSTIFLVAAICAIPPGPPAGAAVETVQGRLIDMACYRRNPKNDGEKHIDRPLDECATTCAKYGLPLAVLTANGRMYQVTGQMAASRNAKLLPHVLKDVIVTGNVTTDEEGALLIDATAIKPAK